MIVARTIGQAVAVAFAAWVALGANTAAAAQDRDRLLDRIDSLRARASAPGTDVRMRDDLLGDVLEAREALMASHPEDAHRPIWLLDQAADTLVRLGLGLEDARLVVGLLDARRHADAIAMAENAYVLADTAGALIDARFRDQQASLDAGEEISEADRALNRRLAERELAVRRPLLMGRAMALQVAGGGPVADANLVLRTLEGVRLPQGSVSGVRDLSMAIALRSLGGTERRTSADVLLQGIIEAEALDPPAIAEAALLRALLEDDSEAAAQAIKEATTRPPFVDDQGLAVPALLVLAIEAGARMHAEAGGLESAALELLSLEQRRDLGGSAGDWTSLANQKLAALAQRYRDWGVVSPDLVLRAARALVARDEPASDELARRMLEDVLLRIRVDAEEAIAADQSFTPPVERDPARSLLARLYLVAAERTEDGARAQVLQARAVELVAALLDGRDAELDGLIAPTATLVLLPPGRGLEASARVAILSRAIETSPEHASANRWRLGRAALVIRSESRVREALDDARVVMRSGDHQARADAIVLAGAAHAALVARIDSGEDGSSTVHTLRDALGFVLQHPDATDLDATMLRLRLAEFLLEREREAGAREAVDLLRPLDSTGALRMTARAYEALRDRDEAVRVYGVLTERLTFDRDGHAYWDVWVRLLELIDLERRERVRSEDARGAQALTQTLRSQLLKLRAQDPELGGPTYAGRIEAIETRLRGDG